MKIAFDLLETKYNQHIIFQAMMQKDLDYVRETS